MIFLYRYFKPQKCIYDNESKSARFSVIHSIFVPKKIKCLPIALAVHAPRNPAHFQANMVDSVGHYSLQPAALHPGYFVPATRGALMGKPLAKYF